MLYIKFKIQDSKKYLDFQKLYEHMVNVRQPNFHFEEEDDKFTEFDWGNSSQEEIDNFLEESEPEFKRYKKLFPDYANSVLESYIKEDQKIAGVYGYDLKGIFNYLEYSFEVDLNKLEAVSDNFGIVEFSSGNYPFGGVERFIMTLKAFDLIPFECFDGFGIFEFNWTSKFDYDAIELEELTKKYVNEKKEN